MTYGDSSLRESQLDCVILAVFMYVFMYTSPQVCFFVCLLFCLCPPTSILLTRLSFFIFLLCAFVSFARCAVTRLLRATYFSSSVKSTVQWGLGSLQLSGSLLRSDPNFFIEQRLILPTLSNCTTICMISGKQLFLYLRLSNHILATERHANFRL